MIIGVAQEQTNHEKDGEFEFCDPVDEYVKAQRDGREFSVTIVALLKYHSAKSIAFTTIQTWHQVNNAT